MKKGNDLPTLPVSNSFRQEWSRNKDQEEQNKNRNKNHKTSHDCQHQFMGKACK